MNGTELLILLVVAAICGAIGQSLAGTARGGLITSIVVGFVGAMLGMWMARSMHLPELFNLNMGGVHFPIVWSIIGGALFVALLSFLSNGPRYAFRR